MLQLIKSHITYDIYIAFLYIKQINQVKLQKREGREKFSALLSSSISQLWSQVCTEANILF